VAVGPSDARCVLHAPRVDAIAAVAAVASQPPPGSARVCVREWDQARDVRLPLKRAGECAGTTECMGGTGTRAL
jgi:hypothetical protein